MNKAEAALIFGIEGGLVSFPVGERIGSDDPAYDAYNKQVGMEVRGKNGHVIRLVRLDVAAGLAGGAVAAGASASCCARVFAYSAQLTGVHGYDVKLAQRTGTVPTNRPVGVALTDQDALTDNDLFWLHVDGPEMDVYMGSDGTDAVIGDYIALDDDTDLGVVYSLGTTFTPEFILGVNLTTQAGVDATLKIRPLRKLAA